MIITKASSQVVEILFSLKEIEERIVYYKSRSYLVTSIAVGTPPIELFRKNILYLYILVFSKCNDWEEQLLIKCGSDINSIKTNETLAKLGEAFNAFKRKITQIMFFTTAIEYIEDNWVLMLTSGIKTKDDIGPGNEQIFYDKDINNLFQKVKNNLTYENNKSSFYNITHLAYGNDYYVAVLTFGLNWDESHDLSNVIPSAKIISENKIYGKIITSGLETKDGLISILCNGTGFAKQRIHKSEQPSDLLKLSENRWKEGYIITNIIYHRNSYEWIFVFSK